MAGMTMEQWRWNRRVDALLGPLWRRWVQPGGKGRIRRVPLYLWCRALALHRWLWRHGIEL